MRLSGRRGGRSSFTNNIGDCSRDRRRRGEGNALGNLGNAYADLGEARRAIEFYKQRLVIAREIGDRRGEGNALWNAAVALWSLDERAEAIERGAEALRIYEAIESPHANKVRERLARGAGSFERRATPVRRRAGEFPGFRPKRLQPRLHGALAEPVAHNSSGPICLDCNASALSHQEAGMWEGRWCRCPLVHAWRNSYEIPLQDGSSTGRIAPAGRSVLGEFCGVTGWEPIPRRVVGSTGRRGGAGGTLLRHVGPAWRRTGLHKPLRSWTPFEEPASRASSARLTPRTGLHSLMRSRGVDCVLSRVSPLAVSGSVLHVDLALGLEARLCVGSGCIRGRLAGRGSGEHPFGIREAFGLETAVRRQNERGLAELQEGWHLRRLEGRERSARPGDKGAGDIITKEQYGSFELSLEFRIGKAGNSGIMFHVTEDEDTPWKTGPEIQVQDNVDGHDPQKAGWLYQLYQPNPDPWTKKTADATRPVGEWNHVQLLMTPAGSEINVNGYRYARFKKGSDDWNQRVAKSKFAKMPNFGKPTKGYLCLQDHGDVVAYRNIKIRELPESGIAPEPIDGTLALKVEPAFPNLTWKDWNGETADGLPEALRPIVITNAADGSGRTFVADQRGRVWSFTGGEKATESKIFFDIRDRVTYKDNENEEGLLGFAFHPQFKKNGQFFVYYTSKTEPHLSSCHASPRMTIIRKG